MNFLFIKSFCDMFDSEIADNGQWKSIQAINSHFIIL